MKLNGSHFERGFTIVELMIALSVLSVILTMSTAMMIQIGGLYSKGVNTANLQNTARNVMSDVSSTLQFGGKNNLTTCTPFPNCGTTHFDPQNQTFSAFCIGNIRYSYILNHEAGTYSASTPTQISHVLWRDTISNSASCPALDVSKPGPLSDPITVANSGSDIVSPHMRVNRFMVTETPSGSGVYNADVWLAFGDDDLLAPPDVLGHDTCIGGTGTAFCAVSELSTVVNGLLK